MMASFKYTRLALVGFLLSTLLSAATVHAAPLRERRSRIALRDDTPPPSNNTAPNYQALSSSIKPQQPALNFDLTPSLWSPSSTIVTLPDLPATCSMYNTPSGECPTTMVASNVTYDDCGDAFTICQCTGSNSTMDLNTAVQRLGLIPVGLRKFIGTVSVMPATDPHAYTLTNGDIHMFGDTQMNTWLHEAAHTYDFATSSPVSATQAWLDAINKDTCATDVYGMSNAVEEFAQLTVIQIFYLTHNKTLPTGWTSSCMSNQLAFMNTLPLFNPDILFSNNCFLGLGDGHTGARHTMEPLNPVGDGSQRFHNVPEATISASASVPSATAGVAMPSTTAGVANAGANANGRKNSAMGLSAPVWIVAAGLVLGAGIGI